MSDAHQDLHEASHEGPIKTPKQLALAVLFAFVVPIAVIILLAVFVTSAEKPAAGTSLLAAKSVAERVAPVGHVEVKDLSDPTAMKTGEQVFQSVCIACHGTGAAGAPKFGDAAAWGPRIGQGYPALLNSALHGKGAMGPQGGGDYSDYEIGRAVVYMANKGGANFPEPTFVAPGAATAKADEAAASAPAAEASAPAESSSAAAAPAASEPAPAVAAAAPVAVAAAASAAPAAAAGGAAPALYTQVCQVCHSAGLAGAPKFGDKAAWAPRVGQGIDQLTANAIHGKGAMPPRGGSTASDAEIKEVVTYMVNAAK